MSSILTNTSSMVALQTLKGINKGMAKVQDEISTGLKVATAKDNSSSWSIASTMSSDVGSYKKLGESLTSASAMVGVARTAAEQISGILKQIQEKVVQADEPGRRRSPSSRPTVTALTSTIISIAQSAQYNGINLVDDRRDCPERHRLDHPQSGRRPDRAPFDVAAVEPRGAWRDAHADRRRDGRPRRGRHPDRHAPTPPRRPSVPPRPGSRRRTPSWRSRPTR